MDELAAAAGKNPYDFRIRHLANKPRQRRVLELAAERAGWGKAPSARFQGIALMEGYTTHVAQVAEISIVGGEIKVHKIVCVVDCGQMVNPRIVESQIESGIVFGLTAALWGDVSIVGGKVQQTNFHSYRLLRNNELPELDVHLVDSGEAPGGNRRGRRAIGCPCHLQRNLCRDGQAPAGIAHRKAEAGDDLGITPSRTSRVGKSVCLS